MRTLKRRNQNKGIPILIDANALAYSAYYSMGGLSYNGTMTGVIFGFLKQVIKVATTLKSGNLFFLWDQGNSFRCVEYKSYKCSRKERYLDASPEEQSDRSEFDLQRKLLANPILYNMGFKNSFSFESFEGDDLIGKLTNQIKGKKIIVTDDNDIFQLLDRADIFLLRAKKMFTKKDFIKKYGIHPDQWCIAKAIGGCSGDDIKGIEGFGDPKSPTSRVYKYLSKEGMMAGKLKTRILCKEGQRIIKRNLPLVTVPYMQDIMPKMKIRKNTVTTKKLIRIFDKYRFISLMEKENLSKWKGVFDL